MFLLVYVKLDLLEFIDHKSLDCTTIGTGLLNRMVIQYSEKKITKKVSQNNFWKTFLKQGNKGGVSIRFKIFDTTICFVCSHLAAGSDELTRRNQVKLSF